MEQLSKMFFLVCVESDKMVVMMMSVMEGFLSAEGRRNETRIRRQTAIWAFPFIHILFTQHNSIVIGFTTTAFVIGGIVEIPGLDDVKSFRHYFFDSG
jgi:hypothetical protein